MTEGLAEHDQIVKVNNKAITSIKHFKSVVDSIVKQYYSKKIDYLIIETQNDKHVYSMDKLSQQERSDNEKNHVPAHHLRLLVNRKKRRRR